MPSAAIVLRSWKSNWTAGPVTSRSATSGAPSTAGYPSNPPTSRRRSWAERCTASARRSTSRSASPQALCKNRISTTTASCGSTRRQRSRLRWSARRQTPLAASAKPDSRRSGPRSPAPLSLPQRPRRRRSEGSLMNLTDNQGRVWRRVAAWGAGGLFIVAVIVAAFATWRLLDRDPEPTAPDQRPTPALIARAEYLPRSADCAACHSPPGRAPFSGGLAFKLPFGVIYSTNITADRDTGIGAWSDDDVVRALHLGLARDGAHLYPAFPYTSYTGLTRDDAVAIKSYLFSLPPVHAPAHPDELIFPFNQRWAMAFWNLVFLDVHRFRADTKLSDQQNRGAYLATALGHCGECHTPRK